MSSGFIYELTWFKRKHAENSRCDAQPSRQHRCGEERLRGRRPDGTPQDRVYCCSGRRQTLGILTERDFVGLIAKEKVSASSLKVVNLMTKAPITIGADSTVDEAGELMTRQGIRRLLVVERNKLVGIVTNRDILLTLLEGLGYESLYA